MSIGEMTIGFQVTFFVSLNIIIFNSSGFLKLIYSL